MVNFKEDERLNTLNHSCAHVMAQAVKHLYPHAKFWVGPVVKEGFYYDIDLGDNVINDEAIEAIEKEMKKICKEGKKIYRREVSKQEALEMFKDDMYKLDLISGLEDGNITVYDQGDFTDLCRGPHVDNTKLCKNFKLVKYSGVYWKGDANNHVMQRIYGVCFPTAEELEEHLKLLEEAKERDHRKIGKEMELFMSDDLIGRGLPMFLPKGYTVWQELENYIKDKERKLGYLHVMTPCVGTVNLYKTSGHWDHYKENMFPAMEVEGESFVLRPMNCPHHMMIYANKMPRELSFSAHRQRCIPASSQAHLEFFGSPPHTGNRVPACRPPTRSEIRTDRSLGSGLTSSKMRQICVAISRFVRSLPPPTL